MDHPQITTPLLTSAISNHLPKRADAPETASKYEFNTQRLVQKFENAIRASESLDQLLRKIGALVQQTVDCDSLWIAQKSEDSLFSDVHALTEDADALWELFSDPAQAMINRSQQTGQIHFFHPAAHPDVQLASAPVHVEGIVEFVYCGCFSIEKQAAIRQQWLLGIAVQATQIWLVSRRMANSETKAKSLNDALLLIQSLDQTEDIRQASRAIVNHLKQATGAEQVALSFCHTVGEGELMAVSDVEVVDLKSESNRIIKNACNQALYANSSLRYPNPDELNSPHLLPLEHYVKSNRVYGCVNVPLTLSDGRVLGAILCSASEEQDNRTGFASYLDRICQLTAGHVDVVFRANRGVLDLIKDRIRKLRKANWFRPAIATLGILLIALCIPLPYRVACDCELRPVLRRFVAAPYAGILEKTLVRDGDVVAQGDVLARMDGRQLRMEIAAIEAEYAGAKKRSESARAQRDIANSQIANSEMKRLAAEKDLLAQRLANLEVRSPLDGIIVHGDLEKAEGAPLETGQTLFEVGPLQQMVAEIHIPEGEIQYVRPGMQVAIKLDAYPFESLSGTIERIHPRAEIVEDESVFVAEVNLANERGILRPGLNGSAKIRAHAYPLGWNLFHRSWETVRCWLIW